MLLGKDACAARLAGSTPPERQQQRERKKGGWSRGSTEGPGAGLCQEAVHQRAGCEGLIAGGARKSLGGANPHRVFPGSAVVYAVDKAASELMEVVLWADPPGATLLLWALLLNRAQMALYFWEMVSADLTW